MSDIATLKQFTHLPKSTEIKQIECENCKKKLDNERYPLNSEHVIFRCKSCRALHTSAKYDCPGCKTNAYLVLGCPLGNRCAACIAKAGGPEGMETRLAEEAKKKAEQSEMVGKF